MMQASNKKLTSILPKSKLTGIKRRLTNMNGWIFE